MLYDQPQTLDSLTNIGCETMFFGWDWDELESILLEMRDDGLIASTGNGWVLQPKGKFLIKKKSLIPIFKVTANPQLLKDFKDYAKDKCNTAFLDSIISQSNEHNKVIAIKAFAQQNYEKIVEVGYWIGKFLTLSTSG